jgi:hypothetical protein
MCCIEYMASFDKREIRSDAAFKASIRHHEKFSSVLRGMTDIDLAYERKGNFVFFEGKEVFQKDWSVANVSWGQWFFFKQLQASIGKNKCRAFYIVYDADGEYWVFNVTDAQEQDHYRFVEFYQDHPNVRHFPTEAEMLDWVKTLAEWSEIRR